MSSSGDDDRTDRRPDGPLGWVRWLLKTDHTLVVYARDIGVSVGAVLLVGLLLFAVSGLWPPMVAVESPSMEPNMERGDLVFLVDNERFTPEEAPSYEGGSTGVVPSDVAAETDRTKFGDHGDVIVFEPDGDDRQTPIIHRAVLWVEEGENWYDRADERYVGAASDCEELNDCPAPYDGFVTRGDNNPTYDQVGGSQISALVHPDWVVGTAELRVPYLGHIRLWVSGATVAPPGDYLPPVDTTPQVPAEATANDITTDPVAAANAAASVSATNDPVATDPIVTNGTDVTATRTEVTTATRTPGAAAAAP